MIDHCESMARGGRIIAVLLSVMAGYDGIDPRMTPKSPLRMQRITLRSWMTGKLEKILTAYGR